MNPYFPCGRAKVGGVSADTPYLCPFNLSFANSAHKSGSSCIVLQTSMTPKAPLLPTVGFLAEKVQSPDRFRNRPTEAPCVEISPDVMTGSCANRGTKR